MTSFLPVDQVIARVDQIRQTLPDTVRLIAVTKQVPVELMRVAYEAGIRDFGENRIQEAAAKQSQLQDLTDVTWHMIGHLQSNKAAKALELFDWIHSVDDFKLAQRLDQLAITQQVHPRVCLQVKILPDSNKHGWTIDALMADLPALSELKQIQILGLMVIPPYGLEASETRSVFLRTRELATEIQQVSKSTLRLQELSMGMSDDYPVAIEAGATMIRLGRTLFGDRL